MSSFLFTTLPYWNLCCNIFLTFHISIIHEHLFQCVTLICHFHTRIQLTEYSIQYQELGINRHTMYMPASWQLLKDLLGHKSLYTQCKSMRVYVPLPLDQLNDLQHTHTHKKLHDKDIQTSLQWKFSFQWMNVAMWWTLLLPHHKHNFWVTNATFLYHYPISFMFLTNCNPF